VGGAAVLSLPDRAFLQAVADQVQELVDLTLGHSVVMDRFEGTAVLRTHQALEVGVLGYVARASGLDIDTRRHHPFADLGPAFQVVTEDGGDVLARYRVRAREIAVSTAVASDLIDRLDGYTGRPGTRPTDRSGAGLGQVEAWRGTLAHRVELGASGELRRVKIVDPSFFNWPALPLVLTDTIVPDFPLANKSFNQSYAGNDL
jgi:Ni,Fe-hydrogenase III large subunit